VAISSPARVIAVKARMEINSVVHTSAPKNISLPHPEKKSATQTPDELIVDPTKINNEIYFFIRVIDENKQGVPNAKLTIKDGKKVEHPACDEFGEHNFDIRLNPGEEREIEIYATGYGDRGYRQTFRGR